MKANDERQWPQILAILTGSLTVLCSGFLYAWPSPFIVRITEDKENYNISEEEAAYFPVLNTLSMGLAPLFVPLVNVIGRKSSTLLFSLAYIISLLIKAFAKHLWLFYFARFIYGLGDAMNYTAIPIYIGEIATPRVRGIWGNSMSFAAFTGYFLVNLLGSYFSVKDTSLIALSIPILFLLGFSFMPESPYYYIMKDKDENAKSSLRWLRGKANVDKEFQEIKTTVKRQMAESHKWKDLFATRSNYNALKAGLFLRIGQHFSGFYAFTTFTQLIFEKSETNISSQSSSLIYTASIVITFTSVAYFSDKLGRRKSYMLSLSGASIIVFVEGIYFYLDKMHPEINLDPIKWFPLVGMLSFVIAASLGIGCIPILMTSELFSASIKAQAVGFITFIHALGSFAVSIIFHYLHTRIGLYAPFFFFALCNVLSIIITYFIVPETKDKTLEEIQEILKSM